jgi:hypothetical protein
MGGGRRGARESRPKLAAQRAWGERALASGRLGAGPDPKLVAQRPGAGGGGRLVDLVTDPESPARADQGVGDEAAARAVDDFADRFAFVADEVWREAEEAAPEPPTFDDVRELDGHAEVALIRSP